MATSHSTERHDISSVDHSQGETEQKIEIIF